jgi:hypothetical protein
MSTESAATSSFPTDEHPYITKAKEIARRYVGMNYCLAHEPPEVVGIEFDLADALWTWGRWTVDLKCNVDGHIYRVLHNGVTGEVTDVVIDPEEQEGEAENG